jgi:cytochrome c oxidase assembly factor CtaG
MAMMIVVVSRSASAHDLGHALTTPRGLSPWDALAGLMLITIAALYALGLRHLAARGASHPLTESVAFTTGLVVLLASILPPLDTLSLERFSVHMAQHELMMLVGVPLMMAGRPLAACVWGLPGSLRPHAAALLQSGPATSAWRLLTAPVVAWTLHGTAIWITHAPPLYEWAIHNEAVHAVQHLLFVGTSGLFWWGLLYGRYGRAGYGAAVFYVFTTTVHTGLLGALITFARVPLYPSYSAAGVVHHVDVLGDQQIAGLLMWVPAGIVLTGTGLALFAAWLGEAQRRSRLQQTDTRYQP